MKAESQGEGINPCGPQQVTQVCYKEASKVLMTQHRTKISLDGTNMMQSQLCSGYHGYSDTVHKVEERVHFVSTAGDYINIEPLQSWNRTDMNVKCETDMEIENSRDDKTVGPCLPQETDPSTERTASLRHKGETEKTFVGLNIPLKRESCDDAQICHLTSVAPIATCGCGETEDLAGDSEDLQGDSEDLQGDSEDLAGDSEDLPADTVDLPGDSEDLAGDSEDLAGDTEDLAGDSEDLQGDSEDLQGDTEAGGMHVKAAESGPDEGQLLLECEEVEQGPLGVKSENGGQDKEMYSQVKAGDEDIYDESAPGAGEFAAWLSDRSQQEGATNIQLKDDRTDDDECKTGTSGDAGPCSGRNDEVHQCQPERSPGVQAQDENTAGAQRAIYIICSIPPGVTTVHCAMPQTCVSNGHDQRKSKVCSSLKAHELPDQTGDPAHGGHVTFHQAKSQEDFLCSKATGGKTMKESCFNLRGNSGAGERIFHVETCGKYGRTDLEPHATTHKSENQYHCARCKQWFTHEQHLQAHTRTHTDGDLSGKKAARNANHPESSGKYHGRIPAEEKLHQCGTCSKVFAFNHQLQEHTRTHTGEKPFQCSLCSRSFGQRNYLKVHMRTHTGEKPFHCSTCSKSFARADYLKVHVRSHTGEKPYQCSTCSKSFKRRGNLISHEVKCVKNYANV